MAGNKIESDFILTRYWLYLIHNTCKGRRGHDCMVIGFTTYAIIVYHH